MHGAAPHEKDHRNKLWRSGCLQSITWCPCRSLAKACFITNSTPTVLSECNGAKLQPYTDFSLMQLAPFVMGL